MNEDLRDPRTGAAGGVAAARASALAKRLPGLLGALLAVAGCAGNPPPPATGETEPVYRVGPSDQLAIRVLPDPALESTPTVRPDGQISVDLIGDVQAAGRTPDEIAEEIESRIARYRQEPLATVSVVAANSVSIAVLGEVARPGRYPLADDTDVAIAIAVAGGATELAAASRVRLIRAEGGGTVTYDVDLDDIQAGETRTNVRLADGDLVVVPPAHTVAVGYAIRRALYPIEAVMRSVLGGLVGLFAGST